MAQIRDADVPSSLVTGVGHPSAPKGRQIGVQMVRWDPAREELVSLHVYLSVDEACVFAAEFADAIAEARARG